MPRNYQCKKNNDYRLPHNVYVQVIYAVRDYDRLKNERKKLLHGSPPPPDGMPRGKGEAGSPTEKRALRLAEIEVRLEAIDAAIKTIPLEYRKGVLNNLIYWARYPADADMRTYRRYKQRVVYEIAKKLYLI